MKRRDFLKAVGLGAASLTLPGCMGSPRQVKTDVVSRANPWTHLNLYNNPDNFQFAIVSDRTGGHRPGVFASAVEKLNLLKPEFVMSIGDLIEGNTRDEAELNRQWDEFDSFVNKLQMPFFYVPGNHDITNEVMAKKWHQRFGPDYYHFIYRNVLFLCLSTEDPFRYHISDQQVEYVRRVRRANSNVHWTSVFMHEPVWKSGKKDEPALWAGELAWRGSKSYENWRTIESLLANRPYTVFAGHEHKYGKSVRNGRRYYVLSTTGAQGRGRDYVTRDGNTSKELLGLAKGEFDHIMWVTMTDDGPAVANILLEGILSDEPCPL